ncbi:glycosyltransferase [Kytococcus sedentarius]|uniref:glycosyltransferase n=1 Tax=Kytococcus sedentarius TaxID=1276 RepID=UPI003879FFD9
MGASLEALTGTPVLTASIPPTGRASLPDEVLEAECAVFLGARVLPHPGWKIFWPLNVAPLDHSMARLPNSSNRNRLRHVALRQRFRQSVSRADALVFGSHYARALYTSQLHESAHLPYRVIPGGTPSLEIPERAADVQTRMILCCSHLYPYKGIMQLVEAVGHIHTRLPEDITFRVAGADRDPVHAQAVHRRITELGLQDRILIREAPPEEMKSLLREALFAIFPSLCENAGSFALYDGLHAGIPTLCSDRSSMPEVVRDGAHLFNPYETERFGALILQMLESTDMRENLRLRAEEWRSEAPTWNERATALLEFVEEYAR